MDTLTVRKRAKEFETIILSNAGTYKLTLSETGLAKALLQAKKEEKRCVVCNWKDCNYTNEEIEECKCPYQTAESILQQFKKEGEKLDKYIRGNVLEIEQEITVLPRVLKQIEENINEIEVEEGFGNRLLTFRYIIDELKYSININHESVKNLSNEKKKILSDWIEKINSILSAEKFVYENEKQTVLVNNKKVTFQTNLNNTQLKELFKQLIDNRFIDPLTYEENFLHVFGEHLPNGKIFEPVKWIFKTAKNEPHKTSLRELINVVTGKAPNQKIIDSCFTDEKGKKIQLAKPKKEANTDYWTDKFKAMIN